MARRTAKNTYRELGTIALLVLIAVWLVFLVITIFRKEEVARLTVAQTQAQLASLGARKDELTGTVDELGTERGQEASLRETFGVAKPGEDVIVVVPKKELAPPPSPTLWQRIKEFFGQ